MLEMPLDLAKALGLFVNTASTITASVMNFRRGVLEIGFAVPLVISILIATPIGAWSSQYVPREVIEVMLVAFLLVAAFLKLFSKRSTVVTYDRPWVLYLIGGSVGVVSGMLGVGGGSLMMPALILLGFDAKKAARAISFVIPFSSAGAFFTYLSFTDMNWALLGVVAVAAILGGYLGERIMHNNLKALRHMAKSSEAVMARAMAGEFFAESAIAAPRYSCDGVAVKPSTLLFLPMDALDAAHTDSGFAKAFFLANAANARRQCARYERVRLRSARERVLHLLACESGPDGVFDWPAPLTELAVELALEPETLYRVLAELEASGKIARDKGQIKRLS